MKPLILASQSPRRKQLLKQVHVPFSIEASLVEEEMNNEEAPGDLVISLAKQKAEEVYSRFSHAIVLGADTIVVVDDHVLGKPKDEYDAKEMLQRLSGRAHQVYTGVYIVSKEKHVSFFEVSDVKFYSLEEDEIDAYVRSGEPADKAGAYGIQGIGATLVESIKGDYFSIVGLPIAKVVRALKEFEIEGYPQT
ncbi:nucleoside triphosphate pyrophosphatase [Evansella sp. AB-rgal1]|uniref:Maf family protein n=1 Tax=Evansella sp. AB-rgal1 TaxID=3242696 RepID=UPI00359CC64F